MIHLNKKSVSLCIISIGFVSHAMEIEKPTHSSKDLASKIIKKTIETRDHGRFDRRLKLDPTGKYMAGFNEHILPQLTVWKTDSRTTLWEEKDLDVRILDIAFSPDGKNIAALEGSHGHRSYCVSIFDTDGGHHILRSSKVSKIPANCLTYKNDGSAIAVGTNRAIKIINSQTGKILQSFKQPESIYLLTYNHDGTRIAATRSSSFSHETTGNLVLLDAITGNTLMTLNHPGDIRSLHFYSDSSKIIVCGSKCLLWDLLTGKQIRDFNYGSDNDINRGAALSKDNKKLIITKAASGRFSPIRSHFATLFNTETGDIIIKFEKESIGRKKEQFNTIAHPDANEIVLVTNNFYYDIYTLTGDEKIEESEDRKIEREKIKQQTLTINQQLSTLRNEELLKRKELEQQISILKQQVQASLDRESAKGEELEQEISQFDKQLSSFNTVVKF